MDMNHLIEVINILAKDVSYIERCRQPI